VELRSEVQAEQAQVKIITNLALDQGNPRCIPPIFPWLLFSITIYVTIWLCIKFTGFVWHRSCIKISFLIVGTLQTQYRQSGRNYYCRYPADRVPLRTRLKSRQKVGCAQHAVACPTVPDPASQHGRAPALPRVPRLWAPPPTSGGIRSRHASHNSEPRLPVREGSGGATCLSSQVGRAPVTPHIQQHQTPPPRSGGLRGCHTSHGTQRPMAGNSKEMPSLPTYSIMCVHTSQGARAMRTPPGT
jgi:hypothetical protein